MELRLLILLPLLTLQCKNLNTANAYDLFTAQQLAVICRTCDGANKNLTSRQGASLGGSLTVAALYLTRPRLPTLFQKGYSLA